MTLTTIISLICVVLNISYTIAASIVCIRKRKVERKKVKSKKLKLRNPKEPPGPAALPAGANIQGAVAAASVPKQLLQKSPTATNQTQKKIIDEHVQPTQPSSKRGESAKDGQKNVLQRIKDRREKKNEVRYEQYKSIKRRKNGMKKGIKLEVAQTQGSNQTEGKLKDQVVNSEEEEEDDTMRGIVSLEQDLNIVSIEE